MATKPVKHVYILGAGFSVPLGGPLFSELFSMSSMRTLESHFEDHEKRLSANPLIRNEWDFVKGFPKMLASTLHEIGLVDGKNVRKWDLNLDAERILELLEVMVHEKENWLTKRILRNANAVLPSHNVNNLKIEHETYRLVKARLALETNLFLDEILDESERWKPYDEWFHNLSKDSSIITTNYDLVLETLLDRSRWPKIEQKRNSFGALNGKFPDTYCELVVAKVHGSCNWYRKDGRMESIEEVNPLTVLDRDIVIGTPGISKSRLASSGLRFEWQKAIGALEKANVISIVGYSLPETDNILRMTILDRIAKSKNIEAVNIVLGTRNERGYRAEEVIRQSMPTKELRNRVFLRNMYAQDFLPIANELAQESAGR